MGLTTNRCSRFQLRLGGLLPFPHQERACIISVAITSFGVWEPVRMEATTRKYSQKVRNLWMGLHGLQLAQPIRRSVKSGDDLAGNIETDFANPACGEYPRKPTTRSTS